MKKLAWQLLVRWALGVHANVQLKQSRCKIQRVRPEAIQRTPPLLTHANNDA